MSESNITKKALANSLKELMKTIPLSKISIQEIVDHCGVNRQTFYYHFKDKYELVSWIYYTEAVATVFAYSNYKHWSEGIDMIFQHLENNRLFYVNALNTTGQNDFNEYLFNMTLELLLRVINEVSADMSISEIGKKFIANFYTHAFVGITVDWVKSGMRETHTIMTERIKDIVDGTMIPALERYSNAND